MSVTLLSPSLARLDRRDAISVDVDPIAKLLLFHSIRSNVSAEQRNVVISASSAKSATTNHFLVSPRDTRNGRRRFVTPLNNVLHLASRSSEFRDLLAA